MWSLRLDFRCKIRVHTGRLVPEASPCDKCLRQVPTTRPLVCADLYGLGGCSGVTYPAVSREAKLF